MKVCRLHRQLHRFIEWMNQVANMEVMFDVKKANMVGIDSPEHYIVENDGMELMRVFGAKSQYYLVTAIACEDVGTAPSYRNQTTLLVAVMQAANTLNISARPKFGSSGRQYVEFTSCEYLSDVYRASEVIIKYLTSPCSEQTQVMPNLSCRLSQHGRLAASEIIEAD